MLGVGESLGSTGSTLWGITSAGPEHTAKVISFNGISTYGAMALGAPLGVVLDQQWGLASLGLLTMLIGAISFVLAARKSPVPVVPGEHLPFATCSAALRRTAWDWRWAALATACWPPLSRSSISAATGTARPFASPHLALAFIAARLLFIQTINRFGGFPVAHGLPCG